MSKPFRYRSIRFFISSTFADMEPERNAIAAIMNRLSTEYSLLGWTIDYIDLRWGVSKESSADNNTMRICLDELRRCKSLSPRPNFLFLIGDRYGWLPLPEIIYPNEWNRIYGFANNSEKETLESSYRFDSNCLPSGRYLLQPIDRQLMVKCLNDLFNRFYKGSRTSATEQEIIEGVFKVKDADEHVVGYIRELESVPEDLSSIYRDDDPALINSVKRMKNKLVDILPTENVLYAQKIEFSRYKDPEYIKWFENEMGIRIRRVIKREIDTHNLSLAEYLHDYYLDIAQNNSRHFYGRGKELFELMSYINSNGAQYPMMIFGEPGLGKTSFMSKVVIMASQDSDYVVVPRFIGSGDGIFGLSDLIVSVFNTLRRYFSPEGRTRYPHPIDSYEANIIKKNLLMETWLHLLDSLLLPGKYAIFLDALDCIPDEIDQSDLANSLITGAYSNPYGNNSDRFNRFEKLRIIATIAQTGEEFGGYELSRFQNLRIKPFDVADKHALVTGLLKSRGRTISNIQYKVLSKILENSDTRGIYLDLIGKYLGSLPSYYEVGDIPCDYKNAARMILDSLSERGVHNRRLLRMTLAVIATAPSGVDMHSLNCILACDNELVDELVNDSFHVFDIKGSGGMIPPILLSRLYSDLEGIFITTIPSSLGDAIVIRHQEILKVVKGWLDSKQLRLARMLQYQYFRNAWKGGNRFAINDVVKVMCEVKDKNDEALALELASVLCNVDYIAQKINISQKYEVEREFDTLIWISEKVDYLRSLIPEIRKFTALLYSLPERIERDVFIAWCHNIPVTIFINRRLIKENKDNILIDQLRCFDFSKSVVGRARKDFQCNSYDQYSFASRYRYYAEYSETNSKLLVEDLVDRSVNEMFHLDSGEGQCLIKPFALQNIVVVLYCNSVICINLTSGDVLFQSEFNCHMSLFDMSVSVSAMGRYVMVDTFVVEENDKVRELLLLIDLNGSNQTCFFPKGNSARFSQSEKYLWTTVGVDTIIRWDISSGMGIEIKYHNQRYPCSDSQNPFELHDALDNLLIFSRRDDSTNIIKYHSSLLVLKDKNYHFVDIPNFGSFSKDGDVLYVYGRHLEILQLKNGDYIEQYPFPMNGLYGTTLLSIEGYYDKELYDMEICTAEQLHYFPITRQLDCSGFSVSQDGYTVCVSNFQSVLRNAIVVYKYQVEKGWYKKFLHADLIEPNGGLFSSCISPSGDVVVCAGSGGGKCKIQVIRASDNKILTDIIVPNPIAAFRFSSDGNTVVAADATHQRSDSVYLESLKFRILKFNSSSYSSPSIREVPIPIVEGKGKIIGYNGFDLMPDNRTVVFDGLVFDLYREKILTHKPLPTPNYYYHIYGDIPGKKDIRLYSKGCLVIGSGCGCVDVFDVETGNAVEAACDDTALALSPNGTWMIMRTPDFRLYRTDLSLTYKKTLKGVMPDNVINVIFHPVKKAFYAITRDSGVYLCDMEGNILACALAVGIIDAKVSRYGLFVLRDGAQVSLFTPSPRILDHLPYWEFDNGLMIAAFRQKYFSR